MEKGLSKYWTPQAEEYYQRVIDNCKTFAERSVFMLMRDVVKYDGRTKGGKKAIAKARLRLAIATDDDLVDMVEAITRGQSSNIMEMLDRLRELKETRDRIKEQGIKRSALECR